MRIKIAQDSLSCSPPRKSLVNGERFMSFEGKPELPTSLFTEKRREVTENWRLHKNTNMKQKNWHNNEIK